jgi:hypothetical protein
MRMVTRTLLTAAACCTILPAVASATPLGVHEVKIAQVDVQVGRDRDRDYREQRDPGVTVGVGPGGVRIGPRDHCRIVTTTVQRDDGRTVTRKERRCD